MDHNNQILKELVHNPAGLMRFKDKEYLAGILAKYPFFQSAQLIYTLVNHQTEGLFERNKPGKSAVYAGSRMILFNYLQKLQKEFAIYDIRESAGEKELPERPVVSGYSETMIGKTESRDPKAVEKVKKREAADKLLDKFIQEQPSVQKPAAEFYSASTMAMKSVQDSDEFMTETLAEIFIKQENYKKAIKIYEKLSLLYPEKSSKFAVLIENLKNKITE